MGGESERTPPVRMHDSITAAHIPTSAVAVAGYVDGLYRWSEDDWALFPTAFKLRIAINASTNDGDVLDIEPGCASPEQAPGWVAMRRAAGLRRPVLYCSRSWLPAVSKAMNAAGQAADYWVADYTGSPHHIAGSIAVQWAGDATSGGHYDLSDIDDAWTHPSLQATGKAHPMYNPAIGPFVAMREWVGGGWLGLGPDGSMYAFGKAPVINGANGQAYFKGRVAADFLHNADGLATRNSLGGPTIVATSGETYALAPR